MRLLYTCVGVEVDGRMTYLGSSIAYTWILQTMRIGNIWKVLEKEIGESLSGAGFAYS